MTNDVLPVGCAGLEHLDAVYFVRRLGTSTAPEARRVRLRIVDIPASFYRSERWYAIEIFGGRLYPLCAVRDTRVEEIARFAVEHKAPLERYVFCGMPVVTELKQ